MRPRDVRLAIFLLLAPIAVPAQTLAVREVRCTDAREPRVALGVCRDALRDAPDDTASLSRFGRLALDAGDARAAVRALERLVRLRPADAGSRLALAQAYERDGRRRDALREYTSYAMLVPGVPHSHRLVAWMRMEMGAHEEALASFREAARLDPRDPDAHHGAGLALSALGRHEEALRALREATSRRPDDAESWGQMAKSALQLHRTREAVSYWERALKEDPGFFDTRPHERRLWERGVMLVGVQPAAQPAQLVVNPAPTATASRAPSPRFGAGANGSGVIVSAAGHVLTNKHVVRSCTTVKVRRDTSEAVDATVVAVDADDDLALLKASLGRTAVASFRAAPALRPGEDVIAVGYPLAGLLADQVNVTTGSISALAGLHNDSHILQMSAPVQPGSSGGPLFDASGNIVGIVVTKLNARLIAEETGDFPQNVNFAIKDRIARDFLQRHDVPLRSAPSTAPRSPADVGEIGRAVAVLIECYK